jgi:hypothetical protein
MACSLFAPRFLFHFRRWRPIFPGARDHGLSLAVSRQLDAPVPRHRAAVLLDLAVHRLEVRQLEFLFEAASTESRPIRSSIEPLFVEWTD